MPDRVPTYLIDADTLARGTLGHVLLLLSEHGGFFTPVWSQHIHDETVAAILKIRPTWSAQQASRRIFAAEAFWPLALTQGYEDQIDGVEGMRDPNDRHLVAAAITAQADVILTMNTADFPPDAATRYGVEVWRASAYASWLLDSNPDEVLDILRLEAGLRRVRPGLRDLLADLICDGATEFGTEAGRSWVSPSPSPKSSPNDRNAIAPAGELPQISGDMAQVRPPDLGSWRYRLRTPCGRPDRNMSTAASCGVGTGAWVGLRGRFRCPERGLGSGSVGRGSRN